MKVLSIYVVLLLTLSLFNYGEDDYRKRVTNLRWMGSKKPDTYREYREKVKYRSLKTERKQLKTPAVGMAKVLVMVEKSIYSQIRDEVNEYINNIGMTGYAVELIVADGGKPEEIKELLVASGADLRGCIMIGRIPSAWFEVENDYDKYGHAEFPCDLFYMDLDGTWEDADGDNKYDTHKAGAGDQQPEIFVARIDASGMDRSEVELLKEYFDRNRRFWNGELQFRKKGIAYTDDDWIEFADITDGLSFLCTGTMDKVLAPATSRDDYTAVYLESPLYYVTQLACHSNAEAHFFSRGGTLDYPDVVKSKPGAVVYNLFCCSALRYSAGKCLGKAYLFNEGTALAVIGSTKTGSMLYFRRFYEKLNENINIGDAMVHWFGYSATYSSWSVYWHYGMTVLGDPMIYLKNRPELQNGDILPPLEVKGERVKNRSLSQLEYINVLEWKLNPSNSSLSGKSYDIYYSLNNEEKLNHLVKTDAATFSYQHRKTDKSAIYHYFIKVTDDSGKESRPAVVTVPAVKQ